MDKRSFDEEKLPIIAPLKVLDSHTIGKRFGWWSAVALIESWGRKQICLYLWQKKGDRWGRKQKFAIHNHEEWALVSEAVEGFLDQLSS